MNLNVASAAEACKVRRQEIEKALKEGRFPGAFYSGESKRGVWMIPIDDLQAAGFHPDARWIERRERSLEKLGRFVARKVALAGAGGARSNRQCRTRSVGSS